MSSLGEKVRLRVLEDRLEQLSSVILPTCLNQLDQQGRNIQLYQEEEDWEGLQREQRNVSKTIRQLRTHVQELEDVKVQVTEEEQNELQRTIDPIQSQIIDAITNFRYLDPNATLIDEINQEQDYVTISKGEGVEIANEVWTELHRELQELKELSQTLSEQVEGQFEVVERLEQQVNEAEVCVQESMITIQKIAKIKSVMLPVGGALLGGVVGGIIGGPVGLLAGAKVGTVVAVAGSTAGAVGGGLIGYKHGQNIRASVDELTEELDSKKGQNIRASVDSKKDK